MVGPRTLAAFMLTLLLAGCAGKPAADDSLVDTGRPEDFTPGQVVDPGAAPAWEVGQHWTHDWQLGDGTAFSMKSIVVANGSDGYRLATDAEEQAIEHASFFFHNLGQMDKEWSIHQEEYVFPWYSFPLTDGKTWTAREENIDFDLGSVSRDLTMTATFVNASGNVPAHYTIEQRTAEGALRATYDYRRDIGWFQDLAMYDPDAPDSPPNVLLHTSSWGKGWTGKYYEATADFVLNYFPLIIPTSGQVVNDPAASFTASAQHTHVMAILFAFAAGGAAHAELVAPDGQHWEANHASDPNGAYLTGNGGIQILVPAVPGDWRVAWAGVSPFAAGGGAFAWTATLTSATL